MPEFGERMPFELTWQEEIGIEPTGNRLSPEERRLAYGGLQSDEFRLSMSIPRWEDISAGLGTGGKMVKREEVYAAIDSERKYQDARWNPATTTSGGKHTLEEWIIYIDDYLGEAKHVISRKPRQDADPEVLHIFRKIASMLVCAMEQHGAPPR